MVLILGAGLAGLTAADHLAGADRLVFERSDEVGGLCRSFREEGFTFDCTGHLLHLRRPELRAYVDELLPDGWLELRRSAWIASHGALTPYPFQANTAGLPLDVRLDCLLGFIEAMRATETRPLASVPDEEPLGVGPSFLKARPEAASDEPSFRDWIERTFGAGFARHFFTPYNSKMWQRDLDQVTGDWVSWSIPRPELADVLRGAITANDKAFGYNPEFLYPRAGGIDALPRAIAARLPEGVVRTGCAVEALDAGRRRVTLEGGESHEAGHVLSSLPITALARMTSDLPRELAEAAATLEHVSIRVVNIGLRGEPVHQGAQWVYVPDPEPPFHRVGLPTALTPAMAPEGHHQLVAEISMRPGQEPDGDDSLGATLAGLVGLGMVRDPDDVVYARVVDIPEAYVVFDRARRAVLPKLLRFYAERGIVPIGRYGTWDYLSMGDAMHHGQEAARWILESGT
jgi:protoporphyrinogen oxidase